MRPAPLAEVAGPQVRAATVGYVAAAGAPLLAVPSLGGGGAIDDTSAHFLLEMALLSPTEVEQLRRAEKRKLAREREEKKREEKKREQDKNFDELAKAWQGLFSTKVSASASSSSGVTKRKRKKKRKKRLPRTRCLPRGFAGGDAPCVMFPSVVVRPEMLCIMADMDQKDSTLRATLAVACVSLVSGDSTPLAVFLHVVVGQFCSWFRVWSWFCS